MSSEFIDIVARLRARQRHRAVALRATSALAPDPEPAFGFAPIRVVAEERLQAVAYGEIGDEPSIVVNANALGREVACLEPLASALDGYLMAALSENRLPRVWVPHTPALEAIELVGHRYRYNKHASEAIRRMGWQCRELAHEARFEGQQVVAIATRLLASHFVTGQAPVEDLHLGSFLAWMNPRAGRDPVAHAEHRSLRPAAAMLEREEDDRVESLRQVAKDAGNSPRGRRAVEEIGAILRRAARREWDLLVEARESFWGAGLSTDRNYEALLEQSSYRIRTALENDFRAPSRPHSLSRLLSSYEHALELVADSDVRSDSTVRERARRAGEVFTADVVRIDQPKRNCKPCVITLETAQEVLRVRRGTEVSSVDGSVRGKVLLVRQVDSAQTIDVDVTTGVRASTLPPIGAAVEWSTKTVFSPWIRNRVFTHISDSTAPLIAGDNLPGRKPRVAAGTDLLAVAEGLRREAK